MIKVRRGILHIVWCLAGSVPLTTTAFAQQPKAIPLEKASERLAGDFGRILSIRELADGRVLISDSDAQGKDEQLLIGDFATGRVIPAATKGDGPGEYRNVGELHALPGDSSIMTDYARWSLLAGPKIVAVLRRDHPVFKLPRIWAYTTIYGADRMGHVLIVSGPSHGPAKPGPNDSTYIVRVDRRSGKGDTIGRMPPQQSFEAEMNNVINNAPGSIQPIWNIRGEDRAVMFEDGWVAVVRARPYLVEWWRPGHELSRGEPLPFEPKPMSDADKTLFLEWQWMHWEMQKPIPLERTRGWPDALPALCPLFPVLAAPDGNVWISRVPDAATNKARVDIVDRTGKLVAWVERPITERLIGFGGKFIYFVSVDEDNVQSLIRYPWTWDRAPKTR